MSNSCDPMDCSKSGSSVHGILQARIQEWAAVPSSRGSSLLRDWTLTLKSPALANRFLPLAPPGKPFHIETYYSAAVWILIFCSLSVTCLLGKYICVYNHALLKFQTSNIWSDFAKEYVFKEFRYDQIEVVPTRRTKKKKIHGNFFGYRSLSNSHSEEASGL